MDPLSSESVSTRDDVPRSRDRLLLLCSLSFLAHGILIHAAARFGPMHFGRPVVAGDTVVVDLQKLPSTPSVPNPADRPQGRPPISPEGAEGASGGAEPEGTGPVPTIETTAALPPQQPSHAMEAHEEPLGSPGDADAPVQAALVGSGRTGAISLPPPIRRPGDFVCSRHERLSYRISMIGVPVGDAFLEATNVNGELRIISRIKSNPTVSLIYPVDNETETRMFNGRYIMTTIRRHEGEIRADVGFTLCLGERKVFWADRLNGRYLSQPVPDENVLDVVTGFYFLRRQPLEVGTTVTLNIFDSSAYSPTPVRVLRREHIALPGLREADTLVIRPELKADGPFRREGELLIWVTDDEYKVPVRIETTIPLGKVTAELVSAETDR